MKTFSLLKQSMFTFLLSVSIAHINANTTDSEALNNANAESAVETTTDQKETIEELRKLILKMITEIDFALETVATYVFSDEIATNNKEQVIDNIRELRRGVSTVARDIMMYADMQSLTRTLKFVTAVQEHIKKAVNNGLREFSPFDVEALQLRSISESTADEMQEIVKTLKKDLDSIKKSAEHAGIYWYNSLYRNTLDRFVIEPTAKYSLHKKAGLAAIITAATTYAWYRFSQDTFGCVDQDGNPIPIYADLTAVGPNGRRVEIPNIEQHGILRYTYGKINKTIRQKLGRRIIDSLKREEWDPTFIRGIRPGKLARLEDEMTGYNAGAVALGALLFSKPLMAFYEDTITPSAGWVKRKFFDTHCWLKGGIYYKHNKNKSHKPFRINPRFRFKDIIGCNDTKLIGREIIDFINDPEKFQRQGIVPPKGILLHGPPGTGKSYWAEALCGEVIDALKEHNRDEKEFGFFVIKSTHIQQMGLDNILSLMKQWAPCIVFIDEIDLLSLQRDRNPERLAEFLSGLSGFLSEADPKKQVIIIGATNKLENVDKAVTRAGRLSKLMYLDYPTFENRHEFLIRTLSDRINPDLFDLEKIARQTGGCTVEDLHIMINTALYKTRVAAQPLTQKDLEDALNSEVRNVVIHQELDLSTEEQRILAVHMAGHAVAQMHLPTQKMLSAITIKPTTEKMREESVWHQYYKEQEAGQIYGKLFTYCPHDSLGTSNSQILLNECRVLLAGRIAEKIVLGPISSNNKRTCSGTCKPNAFNIAKQILLEGLDENQLSKPMKEDLLTRTHQLLQDLEKEVTTLLEQQKPLLMFIADTLIERKTVTYEEIMFTLQQAYEQAAKENPELIQELEKQMQEQADTQASSGKTDEESVRQALSDELGITEESADSVDGK